jgi:uncharacterized protein YicC (UPF0701 family)
MSNQETIILKMTEKLKSCDEQEMRRLCTLQNHESTDEAYQTLDRWTKLDPGTQRKILNLIKTGDVHEELHRLKIHITRLMETPKDKVRTNEEKGQ